MTKCRTNGGNPCQPVHDVDKLLLGRLSALTSSVHGMWSNQVNIEVNIDELVRQGLEDISNPVLIVVH